MTNQPPTIKDVLKELSYIQEKIDHLPLTDEIQQIQCNLLDFSKYLSSYLSEVLEYLQGEIENVAGKKFPLGERKWCVECAQRIRKELNNKIKKLKGEK